LLRLAKFVCLKTHNATMAENEFNIDWLILTHGEFLNQFGIDRDKIFANYYFWKNNNPDNLITNYFCELLRQAGLYNVKNADTEEEFYNSKLQLDSKMLEYATNLEKEPKNYLLKQIHFDKLMISRLTLPFKFDVQINSDKCCSYCAKKNKKVFPFEKAIEKHYLPFIKCKNENGCSCFYSVIPLNDKYGKLVPKDLL